jgi:hypothetical protein
MPTKQIQFRFTQQLVILTKTTVSGSANHYTIALQVCAGCVVLPLVILVLSELTAVLTRTEHALLVKTYQKMLVLYLQVTLSIWIIVIGNVTKTSIGPIKVQVVCHARDQFNVV